MASDPPGFLSEPILPVPVDDPGDLLAEPRRWEYPIGDPCPPALEGGMCGCDEPQDGEPADCYRARCDH